MRPLHAVALIIVALGSGLSHQKRLLSQVPQASGPSVSGAEATPLLLRQDSPQGRAKRDTLNQAANPPSLHLSPKMLNLAFFFYNTIMNIVKARKTSLNESKMQKLAKELSDLKVKLRSALQQALLTEEDSSNAQTSVDKDMITSARFATPETSQGEVRMILLTGPLPPDQSNQLDRQMLQLYLKFDKAVIQILGLTPLDFDIDFQHPLDESLMQFLFGRMYKLPENSAPYLKAVSDIYNQIRMLLDERAKDGSLPAQTVASAKKIIQEDNNQAIMSMVKVLKLQNVTSSSAVDLADQLQTIRSNGSLSPELEMAVNQTVYTYQLKTTKSLATLLNLSPQELNITDDFPKDLLDSIFSPPEPADDIPLLELSGRSLEPAPVEEPPIVDNNQQQTGDFFCLECFFKAYTKWKQEQDLLTREERIPDQRRAKVASQRSHTQSQDPQISAQAARSTQGRRAPISPY